MDCIGGIGWIVLEEYGNEFLNVCFRKELK